MAELIDLIQHTFLLDFEIDANTPLISSGLVDSLHLNQLLLIIENKYGVSIDSRDIGTDNFDTPRQIAEFVKLI